MSIFVRLLALSLWCGSTITLVAAEPVETQRRPASRSQGRAKQDSRPGDQRKTGGNAERGNGNTDTRGAYGDAELQKLQRQAASLHRQIQYSMQRNTGRDSIRRLRRELDDVLEKIRVHRTLASRQAATQKTKDGNARHGESTPKKRSAAKPAESQSRPTGKKPTGQRPPRPAESRSRANQQKPNGQKPNGQKPGEGRTGTKNPGQQAPAPAPAPAPARKPEPPMPTIRQSDTKVPEGPKSEGPNPSGPTAASSSSIMSGPFVRHDIILAPSRGHSAYQGLLQYQHCPPDLTANYINYAIHHLHTAGLSHHATALSVVHPAGSPALAMEPRNEQQKVQQLQAEIAILKRQLAEIHAQQQK